MSQVQWMPEGFHALTPHLVVNDAQAAIAFYKLAFGAVEICRMPAPDGKRLMHAELRIGDSVLMLCDAFPEYGSTSPKDLGGSPVTVHLYVEDVDAVFDQALLAGAQVAMHPQEMFWGDRYGKLTDPFGHHWSLATHVRDVSQSEMVAAAQAAFK